MEEQVNGDDQVLMKLGLTRAVVWRLTAHMRQPTADENESKYNPEGLTDPERLIPGCDMRDLESLEAANFGYVIGCDYEPHYLLGEFDE